MMVVLKEIFIVPGHHAKGTTCTLLPADTAMGAYKKGTFKISCSVTKTGEWQIVKSVNPNSQSLVYVPLGLSPESETVIDMTSVQFRSILLLTLNGQPATITKTWTRQ
jgi:hypothetical protein